MGLHQAACFEFFDYVGLEIFYFFMVSLMCRWRDLYESRIGNHNNSPPHLISHGSVITNVTLIPIKITKNKNQKISFSAISGDSNNVTAESIYDNYPGHTSGHISGHISGQTSGHSLPEIPDSGPDSTPMREITEISPRYLFKRKKLANFLP